MTPEQLRSFLAVSEEGHFGRAAHRLGISPSALSRRIAALEAEVGRPLFRRTSREVEATRIGRALAEPAGAVLKSWEAFSDVVHHHLEGRVAELRLAYCGGVGPLASTVARALQARHPDVHVQLLRGSSPSVDDDVRRGHATLGISRNRPSGLASAPVAVAPHDTVVMPEDHPLADLDEVGLDDLRGLTLLTGFHPTSGAASTDVQIWSRWGTEVIARYVDVGSEDEFLDKVAAGEGLAIGSRLSVELRPRRDLVARPLADSAIIPGHDVFVVWRHEDADVLVREGIELAQQAAEASVRPRPEPSTPGRRA